MSDLDKEVMTPGAVVAPRCGGPTMVVESTDPEGMRSVVVWFSPDGDLKRASLGVYTLMRAEAKRVHPTVKQR